jgi:hypothetical protein
MASIIPVLCTAQRVSEYMNSVPEAYHSALRSALAPLGLPSALLEPLNAQPAAAMREAVRQLAAATDEKPRLTRTEVTARASRAAQ